MARKEPQLKRFRVRMQQSGIAIPPHCLAELEASAKALVCLYLEPTKPKRLRPSWVARELRAMAKGLDRAVVATQRVGEQGMLHMMTASNSNTDAVDLNPRPHVEYLVNMARWAQRAAVTASELSKSAHDNKGGLPADQELNSLIVRLMVHFERTLAIRPTHTPDPENPDTGIGESLFDWFVEAAIVTLAPNSWFTEHAITRPKSTGRLRSRKIGDAISRALSSRDLEWFSPPPLSEE
jgi:hypothetical protein